MENFKRYILFLFFIGTLGFNTWAQLTLNSFVDLYEHHASNGLYLRGAGQINYSFQPFNIRAGVQCNFFNPEKRDISAFKAEFSTNFVLKRRVLDVSTFYQLSPFSELLRESNWGFLAEQKGNRFVLKLGTSFRNFAYTPKAIELYSIEKHSRIYENWNLLYAFSYYWKPIKNDWNLGLTLTNFDHFQINQETNPVFNLKGNYKINEQLSVFSEIWYITAGAFNLNVNYFGYYLRTGIQWRLN